MAYDDYADEGEDDQGGSPNVEDEDEGDDDDLLACPNCHRAVHEDTQQCPYCGDWIVPVWPRRSGRRLIWVVAAVLVILSMIMMTVL